MFVISITLVGVRRLAQNPPNERAEDSQAGRPTMCRNCGSIIGAGQSECAVCGASVGNSRVPQAPRTPADNEAVRFARAVLDRPYKFTIVLLVANIFVFLLMWNSSGMTSATLWEFDGPVLWAYGAKLNSSINEQYQWWRLVTPMFVHVGLLHLLINMYSLWVVGPYVEKLYGSAKFVALWLVTGVAGVVASYLSVRPGLAIGPGRFIFKNSDMLSAGASGALFGLVGVLFVFGIKFRRELPEGFRRAFGTGLLPMILLNLFIGYMGRGLIDNAAHLGGLISGGILALAVDYRRPGEKSGIAATWKALQIMSIALVAISFLKVAQHFGDPVPPGVMAEVVAPADEKTASFLSYAKAMTEAQEVFYQVVKDSDVTKVDSAVKALDTAPGLDPKAEDLRDRLKALLIKARGGNDRSAKEPGQDIGKIRQEQNELMKDFVSLSKEYNQWLKTNAGDYGLVEVDESGSPK